MSEESSKPAEQSTEPIAVEPTPQASAAPSAPAPKSRVGLVVLLAAGAIVLSSMVSCGIGLGIGASGEPDEVSVTKTTTKTKPPVEVTETVVETQTVTVTPAPPTTDAAGLVTTFGPGTWLVGVDIAAGTYRTTAEVTEDCYWEINPSAGSGDILENDIPGGGIPTVNLTDGQQFNSSRCGSWAKQ